MPIDSSLSDMPWLTQPGNAGASLAQGAAAGAHIANARYQSASLAQRHMEAQREQGMQERRLAMELAQAPLKQTLLQQTAEKNALDIQQELQSRQNYLSGTKAFTSLQADVTPLLEDGQLEEAQSRVLQSGLSNSFLLTDPRYKALSGQLDAMAREAEIAKTHKGMIDARLKAADTSAFKALPMAQRLELQARGAEADGDQDLAEYLRGQAALEGEKLKVRQGELVARQERTKAIQARTESLSRSLSQVDRIAMQSELRSIDDRPESKMPYEEKVKLKEAVHEKYASRAKTQNAPAGAAPVNTTAPAAAKVHVRSPDGKLYLLPRSQLDEAIKQGYKPE